MFKGLPAPLIDIPDTQTVSAGRVSAVLDRYVAPGPWERISRYYELNDGHRARDFQGPNGDVWIGCELLVGTVHGYKVRLAVFPKCQCAHFIELCARIVEQGF